MTDLIEQLEKIQAKHPVLAVVGAVAAAVVGKKEYDRRYHTRRQPKDEKEEDE